jgi:hypothetical protein
VAENVGWNPGENSHEAYPVTDRRAAVLPAPGGGSAPDDGHILGTVLGYATFAALGLIVPFLIFAFPDSGRSSGWVMTFVILLVSALRLSLLVAAGERRLFEFIFWVFSYVFFGLAPTVQIRADRMPTTTLDLDPTLDGPTAALAMGGVVSFAIGFAFAHRHSGRALRPPRTHPIHRGRLVLLTIVGFGATGYYLSRVGPANLFTSRAEFGDIESVLWPDPTVGAIVGAASAVPILIAAHGWWNITRDAPRKSGGRIIATVLTAVSLLVTNPISSARYHFGVIWGSFLGPLGAYSTRRRTSITMIGIIIGLLFLFPIADLFRRRDSINAIRTGFLTEYEGNGDYDAFGQLSNALLLTQTTPLEPGRQLIGLVLFWVPRSVWPDKPNGTGVVLAEFRGYNFTNLSAPIWAEMLVNFGIVGVFVLSFLVAVGLGRLDRNYSVPEVSGVGAIAAAVLPFYLLILLRGSLLQAMGTLVLIVLSLAFIGTRSEGSRATGPGAGPNGPRLRT